MKVFCIGFHKTGTTSMQQALTELGYKVAGPQFISRPDLQLNILKLAFGFVDQNNFNAFQDNPWPILFKDLDERYPGSKFIVTLRNINDWYKSNLNFFGNNSSCMREFIYGKGCGSPMGNERVYKQRFKSHYKSVERHFQYRPDDLLWMNLAEGDGWDKLCPFLGLEIKTDPFPHANKRR